MLVMAGTGTLDANLSSMYVQAWNSLSSSSLIIKNAGEPSSKEKSLDEDRMLCIVSQS